MHDIFEDIVGYEDIKKELTVINDMLNNTELYKKMGAFLDKGIILYGEPGTGKTTMANSLIRANRRNCYTCRKKSSDGVFLNKIVETFDEAKKNAPSIVFLDDVDKFSDMEEDNGNSQEFVTIQTCIDEIGDSAVFVIATANQIEKLPNSLLRPGRLGKKILVRLPRKDEATEIVDFYLKKAHAGVDFDPESISRMLSGESCATLEDVIRVAAVKAVFNRQEAISMENIVDACLDLVFEAPESEKPISQKTLNMTAYHEAGHIVVSEILEPGSVSLASIRFTKSEDFGFVRYSKCEKEDITFTYYESQIKTALAGKAAVEVVFGETDIRCFEDLRSAFHDTTQIVDQFCGFNFSCWQENSDVAFTGNNRQHNMVFLIEMYYMEAKRILIDHRGLLDKIALALLEKKTLIYSDVRLLMGSCK